MWEILALLAGVGNMLMAGGMIFSESFSVDRWYVIFLLLYISIVQVKEIVDD